jgi:hypothetical protein
MDDLKMKMLEMKNDFSPELWKSFVVWMIDEFDLWEELEENFDVCDKSYCTVFDDKIDDLERDNEIMYDIICNIQDLVSADSEIGELIARRM